MTNLSTGTGIVLEPVLIFEPSEPVSFDVPATSGETKTLLITGNKRIFEKSVA